VNKLTYFSPEVNAKEAGSREQGTVCCKQLRKAGCASLSRSGQLIFHIGTAEQPD